MDIALAWANDLGSPPGLPESLRDRKKRAEFLDGLDKYFGNIAGVYLESDVREKEEYLRLIAELSEGVITDVADSLGRVNITFRLWSGCLWAAKTIALETRDGLNTPEERESQFRKNINIRAQKDPIFHAGVESAKYFKERRGQSYSFDGLPRETIARYFSD